MTVLKSAIQTRSEEFGRNQAAHRALVEDLRAKVATHSAFVARDLIEVRTKVLET